MEYKYRTNGTCAKEISFEVINGKIHNVKFLGGCMGNTTGISALCEGRDVEEVIQTLEGIKCGFKGTSCPDQLSKALKKSLM